MDSHLYRDVHDENKNYMDSNSYRVVHDKTYTNIEIYLYIMYMTKTYNNMDITYNGFNQLITHNIHKKTTQLI